MGYNGDQMRRLLSRREIVRLFGATGAVLLTGGVLTPGRAVPAAQQPPCIVRPKQMEGPYFIDEQLHRSDIRPDPSTGRVTPGIPLTLTLRVMSVRTGDCRPLSGTAVDIWHCDAMGFYSDVQDPWFNTKGRKFLRGYQVTDTNGEVRFVTIYPGWYPGRTVHIHIKIRTAPLQDRGFDFTSQLYFDDALTDHVHANPPYASRGLRTVRNRHDWIFRQGGDRLMLDPTPNAGGYAAVCSLGLNLP
ncbi:MAG: intradiol ring-cleavage dioxygenase [Nitrospira sp.]|nr:intradiol ring-cleavage dioxygenase [Nitrospira sp.]